MKDSILITNDSNKKLGKRISELIKYSEELKFLIGFFYFSGIQELYQALKANPSVQIKVFNRQARQAMTIDEQHQIQEKIKELGKKKRRQRQRIFDVEDEIIKKRDSLIDSLEKRMQQRTSNEPLFTIRWQVV